jgi:hypothetical protein
LRFRRSVNLSIHGLAAALLLVTCLLCCSLPAAAQETVDTTAGTPAHSPRKAMVMSLIVPGMGQVYNQKYWKVPIIYGAGGALVYFVGFNQLNYKKYRDANLEAQTTGQPVVVDGRSLSASVLGTAQNYYRRYRDLSVFGVGAIYLLNVIDAMIDAHFFSYDVSDDLSLRVEPSLITSPDLTAEAIGFRIRIGF